MNSGNSNEKSHFVSSPSYLTVVTDFFFSWTEKLSSAMSRFESNLRSRGGYNVDTCVFRPRHGCDEADALEQHDSKFFRNVT